MDEFALIAHYFVKAPNGDDAAVIAIPSDKDCVISTDSYNEHIHFNDYFSPEVIARRSLEASVSDLAAMGATPQYVSMALTLPKVNNNWLDRFSQSLWGTLEKLDMHLIGGDTTKGASYSITYTVHGLVDSGCALRRSGAKPGDLIYLSGELGSAICALHHLKESGDDAALTDKLFNPEARVQHGQSLLAYATASIDISDGLCADLGHILQQSGVGAVIEQASLPTAKVVYDYVPEDKALDYTLYGGDEYELCFTVPKGKAVEMEASLKAKGLTVYCIGEITQGDKLMLKREDKPPIELAQVGFQHFKDEHE